MFMRYLEYVQRFTLPLDSQAQIIGNQGDWWQIFGNDIHSQ